MTETVWLVRYGEVFLKSEPVRRNWEACARAGDLAVGCPGVAVQDRSRPALGHGPGRPRRRSRRVFGVVAFSPTVSFVPPRRPGLAPRSRTPRAQPGSEQAETFAIRVKRSGKHAFRSPEKAAPTSVASSSERHTPTFGSISGAPTSNSMSRSATTAATSTTRSWPGRAVSPEGVEGTLVALFSGGIDSPVAAYMMMRRGCRIVPLYVGLEPYLDEDALAKARAVLAVLRDYDPDLELTVRTDDYLARARALMRRSEERLTCVVCKRRMYRLAAAFADEVGALGFVTGESLGQVASQTLDNLAVLDGAVDVPVFRPLIGLDKEEIIGIARRIGTFTPSIAPGRGCRAVPDVAATKSVLAEVEGIEARTDRQR